MKTSYILTLPIAIVLLSGCYNCDNKNVDSFKKPDEADVTVEEYRLQPADEITVSASRVPELHLQTQAIRPDGKVSYEIVGDVSVAGKTPDEVAKILADKISHIYKMRDEHPIDVQVSGFASKLYYILGQVRDPGAKIFTGRETALSAIAKAVPTFQAWEERIRLVRPSTGKDVRGMICKLNFHKMIKYGDMSKNVLLEEGDVIYVPPTILAAIGLTVGELVTPVLGGAGAVAAVNEATAAP
ncbi:MAG: polysaccharide biosynthesis/export family protein [Phycisphaerae bacterium]|nr:polysaccharide biosynthesis/export family protein [Phycisphaerae bacterium]